MRNLRRLVIGTIIVSTKSRRQVFTKHGAQLICPGFWRKRTARGGSFSRNFHPAFTPSSQIRNTVSGMRYAFGIRAARVSPFYPDRDFFGRLRNGKYNPLRQAAHARAGRKSGSARIRFGSLLSRLFRGTSGSRVFRKVSRGSRASRPDGRSLGNQKQRRVEQIASLSSHFPAPPRPAEPYVDSFNRFKPIPWWQPQTIVHGYFRGENASHALQIWYDSDNSIIYVYRND